MYGRFLVSCWLLPRLLSLKQDKNIIQAANSNPKGLDVCVRGQVPLLFLDLQDVLLIYEVFFCSVFNISVLCYIYPALWFRVSSKITLQ